MGQRHESCNVRLRDTLAAAQTERNRRPERVNGPDGPERAWVAYERTRMHETVNELRAERGLSATPVEDVLSAERLAVGHSDYNAKFAFYCAELTSAGPVRPDEET